VRRVLQLGRVLGFQTAGRAARAVIALVARAGKAGIGAVDC